LTALRLKLIILMPVLFLTGCGGGTNLANLNGQDLYQYGMTKYAKGKYLTAIEALQMAIFNYPGESHVDTAQYYLALSYYGNHDYVLGQVEFNRLLTNYPASAFAPNAQLMKAICYFKGTPKHFGLDQSDLQTAISQFNDFIQDHPESEAIPEARQYLTDAQTRMARKYYESGVVYSRVRDYTAARLYFQKVVDEYTNTDFASDATYQIAESYYQGKDWDKAEEQFTNFGIVWPQHKWTAKAAKRGCEALYKGGTAAMKAGDSTLARKRFERYRLISGTDKGKQKEVDEYLRQLGDAPAVEADSTHAGS
jgi:outer membrane protein assembly factor BamD